MNDAQGHFANSDKKMRLPSYNFCLKKRLDELAQFNTWLPFGKARQPVKSNPRLSFNTMD
jgi:hypothetical protein